MELQNATGVVLASFPAGEADRIARIFTREYGKRNFVFKGIRKSKRRAHAVSEPGAIVELVYYHHENREFQVAGEFQVKEQFYELREDLGRILHLYLVLEAVEKSTGFNDANSTIFDLLSRGLGTLASSEYPLQVTLFLLIHLFRLHGILPDFSSCKRCGRKGFGEFSLDYHDITPVCGACGGSSSVHGSMVLHGRTGDFLRAAVSRKFREIDHSLYAGEELEQVLFSFCIFIENYYNVILKSKDILFPHLRGSRG